MSQKKVILVVDDEKDLLEMMEFQLKASGFDVLTAENGREALRCLKNCVPDLIILDLNMPEMGGIEFYEEIRDKDHKTPYPIIALTAEERIEGLFENFNIEAYLAKPVQFEKLINMVHLLTKNTPKKNKLFE